MVNVLQAALANRRALVLDGALATELARGGFDVEDELWSARALRDAPEHIAAVHAAYLAAGADIVTSAGYQATVEGFVRAGTSPEDARELLRLSVRLAKRARNDFRRRAAADDPSGQKARPLVAASVGPYGAFLADGSEYRGDYDLDEETLLAFHRERIALFAGESPDVFAFETIPCFREARALVRALAEHPGASAWVSFSCRDSEHLADGSPLAEAAAWLDAADNVAAVGVNCVAPDFVPSLLRVLRGSTRKPLIVYPNSGEIFDTERRQWTGERIDFGAAGRTWLAGGARIVGGCCRTTPDDIRALARAVDAFNNDTQERT